MEYNYDVVHPWGIFVTEVSLKVMEGKKKGKGSEGNVGEGGNKLKVN
jgi:hypothetical protein